MKSNIRLVLNKYVNFKDTRRIVDFAPNAPSPFLQMPILVESVSSAISTISIPLTEVYICMFVGARVCIVYIQE